ncbi:MAG TPA: DUF2341 domain-containing protein [Chitinivibrionales bacterium]|jgi:hypothetical protein|nr:DUF2341 domain-containing protein [Chitinivibrionales bacterium]
MFFRGRMRWAWLAAFVLASCSNDYNPFTDLSKARAVVTHKSFADRDTLNIFTTETLVVNVADRELVDSFSILAPSNRRAPDTFVVRKAGQPLASGPYTYLLSLTDTGWKTVTVSTFRNNGDRVPQEFFLYLRSPLRQSPLSGAYGDSVALSTPQVGDTDVAYHWDFGGGSVVSSSKPKTVASVKMSSLSNAGSLWVSDPSGAHPSPAAPFSYTLKDTTGPIIKCVSDGYVGKDTIITGDTTFYFKVQIWDPAQTGAVQSASVNGRKFDIDDDPFYICILTRMDTNVRLFPVTVSAVNNPQFRVSSAKTFWFQFSSTMAHGGGVLFSVTDPSTDTSVTSSRTKGLLGNIEDYVHDSILVIVKLWENNASNSLADTVRGKGKADWSFSRLPLAIGSNIVRLAAYSANGDSLAGKSLLIVCDTTLKDTTPPVIVDVTANGAPVANKFVTDSTAVLRIIAFDEGSGVDSLFVNKRPLAQSAQGNGFIWFDTVSVSHRPDGSAFAIIAVDNALNRDTVSFVLCQNRPPQILRAPPAIDTISLGSRLVDTIIWTDPDNDPVKVQKARGPDSMNSVVSGQILQLSWTPQLPSDTGLKKVVINLSDGYQTATDSFQVFVTAAGGLPPAVQIDTAGMAVPAYLEANKDSLVLNVKTRNDSGNAPLSFSAMLNGAALSMAGPLCVWHPGLGDTGKQTISVTVTDVNHRSVSALFPVTVVPPNRPCTLAVKYSIPVTSDGELNMYGQTAADTLFFIVNDPDLPAVERHTVTVKWPSGQTQFVADSTGLFKVILPPKPPNGRTKDTLLVSVTDRAGHADSLRFFITYGPPGPEPFTGRIYISTLSSGAAITGTLYGFPLLVRLDTTIFTRANFAQAAPNGRDVRFKNAAGAPLPYQIERWDNSTYVAEIWVKVDAIIPSSDSQYIVMTWGSGSAVDSSNGTAVFDTAEGYMGVWHMNDGSPTQNANSAQAQFNATPIGGIGGDMNPTIGYGSGIIAGADSLVNSRYLNAGLLPTVQNVSMSAWVNPTVKTPWIKIICKPWPNYGGAYQVFSLEVTGPRDSAIQFHVGLNPQFSKYAVSADSLQAKVWTHLAGTYDGATIRLYVNGAQAGEYSWTMGPVPPVPSNQMPWTIGGWGGNNGEILNGKIDEPRIYNGVWSPDYIRFSYENQRLGSAVLRFK